jgi:TPR repeat protein
MVGGLLLVGCASSTPMKELKPSEMIVSKKNKYLQMSTPDGLSGWEKGLWAYNHGYYNKARELLEPYKDKNISMIQHAFGVMYQKGLGGLQKDYKKAAQFYKKAIEIDNYPNSMNNLAELYLYGAGVSKDIDKASELYHKSAKAGCAVAQFNLGSNYHFGRNGFSKDYGKAYYWYQQASNQGHPMAARRIGYMYEQGNGFEPNIEKALYWHKIAAKRGNKFSKDDAIRLLN